MGEKGTRVRGLAKGRPETRDETTATATAYTFAARNRLADWLRLYTSGWTDARWEGKTTWVLSGVGVGMGVVDRDARRIGGVSRTNRAATARDCHVHACAGAGRDRGGRAWESS